MSDDETGLIAIILSLLVGLALVIACGRFDDWRRSRPA